LEEKGSKKLTSNNHKQTFIHTRATKQAAKLKIPKKGRNFLQTFIQTVPMLCMLALTREPLGWLKRDFDIAQSPGLPNPALSFTSSCHVPKSEFSWAVKVPL
jgi:hypothetical protein